MNRHDESTTNLSRESFRNADGFRWAVAVIDFVLGLGLSYLGGYLFFRRGADFFSHVPDGFWGILLTGYGIWVLYSGYRLVKESPPACWQMGKRRHLISAGISGLVIPLMWLSLFGNSGDSFGPITRLLNYSGVLGGVLLFSLVAAYAMSRLALNQSESIE